MNYKIIMSLVHVGIGVSQKDDLVEAAREAAQKAKEKIEGRKPKLLMFFLNMGVYSEKSYQKALDQVYNIFEDKQIPLVGGLVIGFFAQGRYYFDVSIIGKYLGLLLKGIKKVIKPLKSYGVSVIALESEYLSVGTGIGTNAFSEPEKAGRESIEMALENLDYNPSVAYLAMMKKGAKDITRFRPLNGFILTPGNNAQGFLFDQNFAEGVVSVAKRTTRLIGGGLCSGVKIEKEGFSYTSPSFQFFNGKIYRDSIISVIFGSDLEIGFGTFTGAEPIEKVMFITKSEGHTVKEIDGKPAVERFTEVYKEAGFNKDPLVLAYEGILPAVPEGIGGFLWPVVPVRYKGSSVLFMNHVREKTVLILSKITKKSCYDAVFRVSELVKEDAMTDDFGFVFYFSCPIRGRILGTKYTKEISLVEKSFSKRDLPIFGIASAGEMAFYKLGQLFGATATITMMGISNRLISEVRK